MPALNHSPVFKRLSVAALALLIAVGTTACEGGNADPTRFGGLSSATSATTSASGAPSTTAAAGADQKSDPDQAVDYRRLLVQAEHLSDDDDTFTARSIDMNPRGMPGASAFFVNADDDRAISNTLVIYPDPATAAATLKQATATLDTQVAGGTATPSPVGADAVSISGTSPEGDKAVTQLLFTEGRALVRLEFESAVGDTTTERFVTNVGKMQQIALQTGLPDTE